jgi:hypothetical protein
MSSNELSIKFRRKNRSVPARIRLHQDLRLDSREKMLALATDMQKLNLSRRQIPDWMADRIYGFEGEILDEDGRPFELDDEAIDLAFNNDGSFRWLSDFFRVTKEPPRQRAQRRVVQRLKLIYLALCIEYCVVNAERRSESMTFSELPDGVETHTTTVIAAILRYYLRIELRRARHVRQWKSGVIAPYFLTSVGSRLQPFAKAASIAPLREANIVRSFF